MPIRVSEKSKVIGIGIQNAQGTPASGFGSAILTKDLAANIGVGDEVTDVFDGIDTRDAPVSSGNLRTEFSFKFPVSFASNGNAMGEPAWGAILRACGFDFTLDGSNKTYIFEPSPIADIDLATATMRRPKNATKDMEFKAFDVRGILGVDFQVKQRPFFTVSNFSGTFVEPTIKPKQTIVYGGSQRQNMAASLSKLSVVKFTLDDKPMCATAFTCDNLSGLSLNRDSTFCGEFSEAETETPVASVTMLSPDWETEFNPFKIGRTDGDVNRYPFRMQIGTKPLHRLFIECDEVQPVSPAEATVGSGTYGASINLRFLSPIRILVK